MPELPDITVYIEALARRITGRALLRANVSSPFLLRSVAPPLSDFIGLCVISVRRLGKRIVLEFEGELFLVLHLMIAGRLHWTQGDKASKRALARFDFETGALTLTEAGAKRRASLTLVEGEAALAALDPGGIEVFDCTVAQFRAALTARNSTLKRALCDPRRFSGIGNAYSDEILHRARLSPVALTHGLSDAEIARLYVAARQTLTHWMERLRAECGDAFPEKVTAFRPGMAVHGRFGEACPDCAAPVQRIRYATRETNYCARCQTGGKILSDRSLARLLKSDWPRSLEELELPR